jgi:hypothetical protein
MRFCNGDFDRAPSSSSAVCIQSVEANQVNERSTYQSLPVLISIPISISLFTPEREERGREVFSISTALGGFEYVARGSVEVPILNFPLWIRDESREANNTEDHFQGQRRSSMVSASSSARDMIEQTFCAHYLSR